MATTFENLDPHSVEYWSNYQIRLEDYIQYYKLECTKNVINERFIEYDYNTEFFNEKVASLYGELDRVKTILSILRYTYETDEI